MRAAILQHTLFESVAYKLPLVIIGIEQHSERIRAKVVERDIISESFINIYQCYHE